MEMEHPSVGTEKRGEQDWEEGSSVETKKSKLCVLRRSSLVRPRAPLAG